jgi:hypothetical protein
MTNHSEALQIGLHEWSGFDIPDALGNGNQYVFTNVIS